MVALTWGRAVVALLCWLRGGFLEGLYKVEPRAARVVVLGGWRDGVAWPPRSPLRQGDAGLLKLRKDGW